MRAPWSTGAAQQGRRDSWGSGLVRRHYLQSSFVDAGEEQAIAHILPQVTGGHVLDIAVGAGRTTAMLAPLAKTYVGIDSSPRMIDAARAAHPHVDLRVADARDLSRFGDRSVDVVVFSYNGIDLLDHEDRGKVLGQINRVLKPGARFALSTLNLDGVSFGESPALRRERPATTTRTTSSPAGAVRELRRWLLRLALTPLTYRNFAKTAPRMRCGTDWVQWPMQAHEFRFLAHFTRLGALRRELQSHGFDIVAAWDTSGSVVNWEDESCDADYMHVVCKKR
jgi:ubiquinone/menaquinone biosynthesis C-methylase UbiE